VAGRFCHDRYLGAGRRLARGLFAAVGVVGVAALTPFLLASAALIRGTAASYSYDWATADHYYWLHEQFGGHKTDVVMDLWAAAQINRGHFADAYALLLSRSRDREGLVMSANRLALVAMCEYYLGRFSDANLTFQALSARGAGFLPDYFLGRLAERDGSIVRALLHYRRSFAQVPHFYPTVYQLVRLDVATGDRSAALADLERYLAATRLKEPTEIASWRAALVAGVLCLPEKEFRVIVH
jgi:hypothetical protein